MLLLWMPIERSSFKNTTTDGSVFLALLWGWLKSHFWNGKSDLGQEWLNFNIWFGHLWQPFCQKNVPKLFLYSLKSPLIEYKPKKLSPQSWRVYTDHQLQSKIILHRIISVVWLTNFLSEIRSLSPHDDEAWLHVLSVILDSDLESKTIDDRLQGLLPLQWMWSSLSGLSKMKLMWKQRKNLNLQKNSVKSLYSLFLLQCKQESTKNYVKWKQFMFLCESIWIHRKILSNHFTLCF